MLKVNQVFQAVFAKILEYQIEWEVPLDETSACGREQDLTAMCHRSKVSTVVDGSARVHTVAQLTLACVHGNTYAKWLMCWPGLCQERLLKGDRGQGRVGGA